jgi:hypothetical protein
MFLRNSVIKWEFTQCELQKVRRKAQFQAFMDMQARTNNPQRTVKCSLCESLIQKNLVMTHIVYCVNRTANEYPYGFIWHSYEVLVYILNLISDLDHHVLLKINSFKLYYSRWWRLQVSRSQQRWSESLENQTENFNWKLGIWSNTVSNIFFNKIQSVFIISFEVIILFLSS